MKLFLAVLVAVVFSALLVLIYAIHINYFYVDVVFYAAIVDGLIASAFTLLLIILLKIFNWFEKILLFIICLIASYSVAISVPTVIDRSLSFYILEKLQQRGGAIQQDSFGRIFAQEYMKEHRLVDVRLTEQLQSGTIVINNGCVTLTEKGKSIANFSRYFRQNWLPKKRLLMGEYTDDLTDPFHDSIEIDSYICR